MHSLDDEDLMPTSLHVKQPLSRQIAETLRSQIQCGEFRPGDRVPGENALMAQRGISRTTARAALAILRNEGLVEARKGSGVFVRRAEVVSVPIDDPAAAADLLRSQLAPGDLSALISALRHP